MLCVDEMLELLLQDQARGGQGRAHDCPNAVRFGHHDQETRYPPTRSARAIEAEATTPAVPQEKK